MTTRTFVLALVAAALAACSSAPVQTRPAPEARDHFALVAEIIEAEGRWLTALQAADFVVLEKLLAPEFVLASGRPDQTLTLDRSGWFKNSRARPEALRKVDGRLLRVAAVGDDFAVAEVEQRWLGKLYFVSDTWVRRNGQWQVVYRHSSPASELK